MARRKKDYDESLDIRNMDYWLERQKRKAKRQREPKLLPPLRSNFQTDSEYLKYDEEYEAINIRLIETLKENGKVVILPTRYFTIRDRLVKHKVVKIIPEDVMGDLFILEVVK